MDFSIDYYANNPEALSSPMKMMISDAYEKFNEQDLSDIVFVEQIKGIC